MEHHVTVGVDGSPESRAAARWAAREALLRRVPLRLVHAEDLLLPPLAPSGDPEVRERWTDEVLTGAAEELRRRHRQLDIVTRCLSGRPSAALAAEAADAALLVLGSRSLGRLVGFIIGSVSLSTLAATETPVVLVRTAGDPATDDPVVAEARPAYGEIVVGVDVRQACDRVLAFAFEEAARRDCTLRAVHGRKLPSVMGYVPVLDPDAPREAERSAARMLADMLLPWRHKFPGVRVEEKTSIGSAGRELVQATAGADLVVVGRHVRRSPLGAHLGPVAHAVLHHAAAPVAVVAHD
ncbi:universal stress protein [Streptomyces sp. NPDC050448]|uniref:universal stress protein n=1 Tax=Streptomyces sp. NPDC050448 TaxID=3155404 RepID=UPI0034337549